MLRQQTRIKKQRVIGYRLSVLKASGSETNQIQQMMRKLVTFATLIGDPEAIFSPGLKEKG